MIRIYLVALLGATVFLSYFVGGVVALNKCNARVAAESANKIMLNANIMEKTNEKVLHTTAGDIRRILREKYTIAE